MNKIAYFAMKLACRSYFTVMDLGSKMIPFPSAEIRMGCGSRRFIPEAVKSCGIKKVMVVTGPVVGATAAKPIIQALRDSGIAYELFDRVESNPHDTTAEAISSKFLSSGCDGFLAIGGGSPIDAAKAAAVKTGYPNRKLLSAEGYFKVLKKLPPIIAVTTTSGSGSEVSMVSVITDREKNYKFCITDPSITPKYAIVDPELVCTVPADMTAATGMDVLTHAVESYITWTYNTNETNRLCEEAAMRVFRYLERAYLDGNDIEAREKMAEAACKAGQAFTKTGLGYVHAIAHKLGGLYDTPHGLSNAVILPIVLEDYGRAVYPQLAHLADICGIKTSGTDAEKAKAFIAAIRGLNKKLGIPTGFDFIKTGDIPTIAKWAVNEGNSAFPVPVIYDVERCRHVVNRIVAEA